MPHIILEYSDNILDEIHFPRLFSEMHSRLTATGLFSINDIKSRAIKQSDFYIANGDAAFGFVTLTLSILSGRENKTKKQLSDTLLELLSDAFPLSLSRLKFSITVQIKEIDRACYGREVSY